MKKVVLFALLGLFALTSQAQTRATTNEEYNYLVSGQLNLVLPGHTLYKSSIDVTVEFTDANRNVSIWELYRNGYNNPCAILMIYKKIGEGTATYICVPDISSPQQMWSAYNAKLNTLNDTGSALQAISYALGMYAASH